MNMNTRRPIHRIEGAALLMLSIIALSLAHQLGFQLVHWGIAGLSVMLLWVTAGILMGAQGRVNLRGSHWALWGVVALLVGLRRFPFLSETLAMEWSGTVVAQMLWGSAFVFLGCALVRGLSAPKLHPME